MLITLLKGYIWLNALAGFPEMKKLLALYPNLILPFYTCSDKQEQLNAYMFPRKIKD